VNYYRNKKFLHQFGTNLKMVRKEHGFTQEKLAYESEIELRQIGRIERGEVNTGIATVERIATTLGIKVKKLFDF